MNKSDILIIVCIAAVLMMAVAFFVVPAPNNGNVDHGDLTILDSDENIVQGLTLTYHIKDSNGRGHAYAKTVVTEVIGDDVKFINTYKGEWNNESDIELSSFSRSAFPFDYTDSSEIPEGVTVKAEGDRYRINGVFTEKFEPDYKKYTFRNLIITLDGTDTVKSVSGQVIDEYTFTIDDEDYEIITDTYTYKTKDSELYADWDFEGSAHYVVTKDDFFDESVIYPFSPDEFEGATITESTEKLGNLDIKVYTVNGEVRTGELTEKYEDYKLYVYEGYIISVSGKIDGDDWRSDITVKINN
ncbi:MAG: hypothetical protein IJT54_09830 [Candidatus Methanomethylophilaceae archaeon]|nr:hypothetical protein [Candidatus Methanomethylophilaceae archaeon]